jgi:hypothetical protein
VKTYKPRQRDGVYVAILPPCKEYNLDYRVNDKTVHTEDIFVECESAYQEINKEIYLSRYRLPVLRASWTCRRVRLLARRRRANR